MFSIFFILFCLRLILNPNFNSLQQNGGSKFIKKKLYAAGVSRILIDRKSQSTTITVVTAKPGIVVGRGGQGIDDLKKEVSKYLGRAVLINVVEVARTDTDAQLVAESIAQQLEKRITFRRAMKQAMQRTMRAGAQGIKVMVSGRLGGAEIARSEWYREGRVPLHTLRADIDYNTAEAHTTYGVIGVKVWIFKGEILGGMAAVAQSEQQPADKPKKAPRGKGRK